ncbi:MAG: FAD-binding domain-containing protein [Synechococcaceae cyanobacterium]|nr:FAD-binding domain-containing protein [Synechococcaceae cyanobacterium]
MDSGDSPPADSRRPAGPALVGVPLAWDGAPGDLPRTFADREALARLLRGCFPRAEGDLSPIPGGRRAAQAALRAIDPVRYGRTRNHLEGSVTRLSPYVRHGVLGLAEVRDAVLARLARTGQPPAAGRRLLQQLGWRDYWQRIWRRLGDGIREDREPPCSGRPAAARAGALPAEVGTGSTGLACMDAFARELTRTGWLHNHARLWLASYLVHWRRVRWQAGADWFHRHLLDGDPASNDLSWQWVAGTFSARPYLFNRAGLEHCGGGLHCSACPRAGGGGAHDPRGCPFEASTDELRALLLGPCERPPAPGRSAGEPPPEPPPSSRTPGPRRPVLWIHQEALGPASPALRARPGRPALFVFDPADHGADRFSLKRLGFLAECLLELPVTIRCGGVAEEVLAFARRHGADGVITSRPVDPRLQAAAGRIAAALPLRVLDPEPFVPLEDSPAHPLDLRRFHRYWKRAEPLLWSPA